MLLASAVAVAQSTSGLLLNKDILPASTILSLSQRESVGTARSMGMGGAFTSLGADMASFGYNPAGFGMYQRNEISVSLGLGVTKSNNNYYGSESLRLGNSAVRASINNVGASFKVYEGTGKLVAINFAMGYNKVADYNYNMRYDGPASKASLADAFADIANRGELGINENGKICDPKGYFDYDMDPYYWGTAIINRGDNGWYPDEIANGAEMAQRTNLKSRGSAGEWSFAFGFNINNIVYLGASLDIQSITCKQTINYREDISYPNGNPDPANYPYQLQNFRFVQSTTIDGSGVGAKFGIVVRPVGGLRIGMALHTPSYYSLAYQYSAYLTSKALSVGDNPYEWDVLDGAVYAEEESPVLRDGGNNRWSFTTPLRLLVGVSYAVGPYAVFSVDYQFDNYKRTKLNYAPVETGYDNGVFRYGLKGVHTLRTGIEAKPVPWLSLRVGGGIKSKVLRKNYDFVAFSEPVEDCSWYASTGIGFRCGKVTSIDLSYQYRNIKYSDYYSYFTQLGDIPNHSPLHGLDMLKHNIAVTFAFRF